MLPLARIKDTPEDFVVEEVPAYDPCGEGEHLYVRFEKRDLTTDDAVRAIAKGLGASPRDAGTAGMKDKRAVTTQTMSILLPKGRDRAPEEALALDLPGIKVLAAARHGNKLKPGHLRGNRFDIVVRGIAAQDMGKVLEALLKAGREGVPNAYGAQRFGRDGDNVERALGWIRGEALAPRDERIRRLHWSAVQSAVFNGVLEARLADGTWRVPLLGDILKKREGALFDCTDPDTDGPRAERFEVSPTGPMVGVKMRAPRGEPLALEERVAKEVLGEGFDLEAVRSLGEGTRRSLRVEIDDLAAEPLPSEPGTEAGPADGGAVRVRFVLPKGAYATTVLSSAVRIEPDGDRDAGQVSRGAAQGSENE